MIARRTNTEHVMLREALHHTAATESIGRRLGDELISLCREAVAAYEDGKSIRLEAAMLRLRELVGRP